MIERASGCPLPPRRKLHRLDGAFVPDQHAHVASLDDGERRFQNSMRSSVVVMILSASSKPFSRVLAMAACACR
jgi:hypothetical protein